MKTIKHIPKIIGHRGGRGLLYPPENSLAAFDSVIKGNGDGIEFDILKTKDDHPVVFHDDFMDQLTNISKDDIRNAIEHYTLDELDADVRLRQVPLTTEYAKEAHQVTGHKIPTFEQVLDLLVTYKSNPSYKNDVRIQNFLLNVEIKSLKKEPNTISRLDIANQIFNTIQTYLDSKNLHSNNFMISSFDFNYLKIIQERNENLNDENRLPIGALICRHGAINDTDYADIKNGIDHLIELGIKPQSINLPVVCFMKFPILADQLKQFHIQLKTDKPLQLLAWPYQEQNVPSLTVAQKNQLIDMVKRCKLDYLLSDNPIEMKKDVF